MFISYSLQTLSSLRIASLLLYVASSAASTAHAQAIDLTGLDLVCPLVEHERQRDLEDSLVELELVENEYRARKQVFEMIEKLWGARSIEQEVYLDYKRLRDRTKVRIPRLTARIAQQKNIVEQYALTCSQIRGSLVDRLSEKIAELQAEYRRLDCELLARDAEIADIDYEFDQAILEATRVLSQQNIKSKYDLVIDEYDLSQSRARSESYRRRTKECKKQLAN